MRSGATVASRGRRSRGERVSRAWTLRLRHPATPVAGRGGTGVVGDWVIWGIAFPLDFRMISSQGVAILSLCSNLTTTPSLQGFGSMTHSWRGREIAPCGSATVCPRGDKSGPKFGRPIRLHMDYHDLQHLVAEGVGSRRNGFNFVNKRIKRHNWARVNRRGFVDEVGFRVSFSDRASMVRRFSAVFAANVLRQILQVLIGQRDVAFHAPGRNPGVRARDGRLFAPLSPPCGARKSLRVKEMVHSMRSMAWRRAASSDREPGVQLAGFDPRAPALRGSPVRVRQRILAFRGAVLTGRVGFAWTAGK